MTEFPEDLTPGRTHSKAAWTVAQPAETDRLSQILTLAGDQGMRNGMPRTVKRMAGVLAVMALALVGTLRAQFDYRAKVVKIEELDA